MKRPSRTSSQNSRTGWLGLFFFLAAALLVWSLTSGRSPKAGPGVGEDETVSYETTSADDGFEDLADMNQVQSGVQLPGQGALASSGSRAAEPLVLSEATRELILNCSRGSDAVRGVSRSSDFSTLDEFLDRGVIPLGGRDLERQVLFHNVHVKKNDGEVLRMHIAAAPGSQAANTMVLKLFGADEDNLPVPRDFPQDLLARNWQESVERFKSQGEVVLEEVSEAQRWGDDTAATLMKRNGRVEQLELYMGPRLLGCAINPEGGSQAQVTCNCM
jgi:hypothetical protein